ncbi:MAG: hypothetical protein KJO17_12085 [Acidimicrobiia bacterium]|nr:hypothetical protein [Acidimicrobiia bacterium]
MRPIHRVLLALLVLAAGCSTTDRVGAGSWGEEAVAYFAAWTDAYSRNDTYSVLDFYTPDATIEDRTGVFRDARPSVRTVLQGNTATLTRELVGVFVGADEALALVLWPDFEPEHGMVHATMSAPYIATEIISQDVASLTRSLRVSPDVAAHYKAVVAGAADHWSGGAATGIYSADAEAIDALSGAVLDKAGTSATGVTWVPATLDNVGAAGEPALFLDPRVYGADPERAIGVFDVADADGCTFRMALRWEMADGLVQREYHYPEPESYRTCHATGRVDGWWTDLTPPGPRDQVETGVVATATGAEISIRNGTSELDELVRWGLRQYREAGLGEPRVDTVTFEPTRRCEGVAGRVIAAGGARDLVLCIDVGDLCPVSAPCDAVALRPRVGMLHELAHAWMLDEIDAATRRQVLDLSGRTQWVNDAIPWADRGVEYAAQVIAWGLADEPVSLVELDRPPCDEVTAAYRLLTGTDPRLGCPPG